MVSPGIMADGDSKSLSLVLFILITGNTSLLCFLSVNFRWNQYYVLCLSMCFFDVYYNRLESISQWMKVNKYRSYGPYILMNKSLCFSSI